MVGLTIGEKNNHLVTVNCVLANSGAVLEYRLSKSKTVVYSSCSAGLKIINGPFEHLCARVVNNGEVLNNLRVVVVAAARTPVISLRHSGNRAVIIRVVCKFNNRDGVHLILFKTRVHLKSGIDKCSYSFLQKLHLLHSLRGGPCGVELHYVISVLAVFRCTACKLGINHHVASANGV